MKGRSERFPAPPGLSRRETRALLDAFAAAPSSLAMLLGADDLDEAAATRLITHELAAAAITRGPGEVGAPVRADDGALVSVPWSRIEAHRAWLSSEIRRELVDVAATEIAHRQRRPQWQVPDGITVDEQTTLTAAQREGFARAYERFTSQQLHPWEQRCRALAARVRETVTAALTVAEQPDLLDVLDADPTGGLG